MTRPLDTARTARERPLLLIWMGLMGLFGCVSLLAGALIAPFFVPGHDWVADTISDLAAGEAEIFMDVALYGFAAGLFAVALAAAHAHLGEESWTMGVLALALTGALVVIVGARNEYGDNDAEGIVIHIYLVYGLGLTFLATPLCMAQGAGLSLRWARPVLMGLGGLWGISAPVFLFLPTGIDGLYERGLGVIACAILGVLSLLFVDRGRALRAAA